MTKKIIFSSGGTGGHIFPAINLMKHFSNKGYKVLLATDKRANFFLKNFTDIETFILKTDTPTGKNFFRKFISIFNILLSIIKSIILLKKEKPDLIFGFGGYASFPISFASRFFNVPLVIYENNMILGRTNKYLGSFSKKIFVAKKIDKNFPKKFINKINEVGIVLDKNILDNSFIKKIEENNFSILVLGGSQGAEIFGDIVPSAIKKIKDTGYTVNIDQQCISKQKKFLIDFYDKNKIRNNIFEFEKNILNLILSADLAISRCGASTTAELVYGRTPFIAVPLQGSIDNHQLLNAKYYENKGCCWILDQNNFNSHNLFNLIISIIKDKTKIEFAKQNMTKEINRDVYNNIEKKIKEII